MYEELRRAVGEAGGKTGAWEDKLPAEERELLPAFQEWLTQTDNKADATATAYRGYVAQAIVRMREGESWKDLSTDIRSAVRAFVRFCDAFQALCGAERAPEIVGENLDPDVEEE
jgi:hypothetical protein